jgi:hypothetical protein
MNPLPLPTDNLYKFSALSGLILVIFSVYTWALKADALFKERLTIELANKQDSIRIHRDEMSIGSLERWEENLLHPKTEEEVRKEGKIPIPASPKEFGAELDHVRELVTQTELLHAEVENTVHRMELNRTEFLWLGLLCSMGITVGIALSGYGFIEWRRLQAQQDAALNRNV